jgi:hypothetical protein
MSDSDLRCFCQLALQLQAGGQADRHITSTLNAYEDGTAGKFRNVGTKSSDAVRLRKRHNTAGRHVANVIFRFRFIFPKHT